MGKVPQRPSQTIIDRSTALRRRRRCQATAGQHADFANLYGPAWPVRSSEALLMAVYQYEVQAGLTLQPNVLFIKHPGGGATNPLIAR